MTSTWDTKDQGESSCKKCGAVYNRTITRLPTRDHDAFYCTECGEEMDKWNSTDMPSYTLIKKGQVEK
jgi:uncharacterized protein (DUF983 family)